MGIIIKNGHVISPKNGIDGQFDIRIADGRIAQIAENIIPNGEKIIDASGKIVAPGLVDIHTHLREPGFEYKEDIETGTRSAARGGITSIACMPNTNPATDSAEIIDYINRRAGEVGCVHVYPSGAITKGLKGEEMTDFKALKEAGAVAVSDDGRPVMNAETMKNALIYADSLGMPVISHCEDLNLAKNGAMNEGAVAKRMGVSEISTAAEEAMAARDIVLGYTVDAHIHIAHVSTRGSVALVRDAKARGIKVTCETCPHYFSLTEEACERLGTMAKMNPPLRTEDDLAAIIEGLVDGTIDAIVTDHAPHHADEKAKDFEAAPNGILGFETSLPLAITELYRKGRMALSDIIACMTYRPADIIGIDKGYLAEGKDADIVIFDTNRSFTVKEDEIVSKAKNTPYIGATLYGAPEYTIVSGKIVLENGKIN